jgi:AcrR family transcriptional regulator
VRRSRPWIDSELALLAIGQVTFGDGVVQGRSCVQINLSPAQMDALDQVAAGAGLDRESVLSRLVGAALAGPEPVDRSDRRRLRRCVELLRALEVHVARVTRSLTLRQLPPELIAERLDEMLELGQFLRRVGTALLPLRAGGPAERQPPDPRP